jgi:hypothetical protein
MPIFSQIIVFATLAVFDGLSKESVKATQGGYCVGCAISPLKLTFLRETSQNDAHDCNCRCFGLCRCAEVVGEYAEPHADIFAVEAYVTHAILRGASRTPRLFTTDAICFLLNGLIMLTDCTVSARFQGGSKLRPLARIEFCILLPSRFAPSSR